MKKMSITHTMFAVMTVCSAQLPLSLKAEVSDEAILEAHEGLRVADVCDGVVVVPRVHALTVAEYAREIMAKDKGARRSLYKKLDMPMDASVAD